MSLRPWEAGCVPEVEHPRNRQKTQMYRQHQEPGKPPVGEHPRNHQKSQMYRQHQETHPSRSGSEPPQLSEAA